MGMPEGIAVADLVWEPGNRPGQPPQFAGEVRRAALLGPAGVAGVSNATVAIVHFADGARTNWHRHPEEQILIVLSGECRFGSETGGEGAADEGQVVRLPGGQRHWHGAAPGASMAHISITRGGPAEWFEPVD
jgi:quercetin dioxygenase-like cupin family protein